MTAEQQAPDLWDPALECGAWRKQPAVIGGPTHTHVCRRRTEHLKDFTFDGSSHLCGCGHIW